MYLYSVTRFNNSLNATPLNGDRNSESKRGGNLVKIVKRVLGCLRSGVYCLLPLPLQSPLMNDPHIRAKRWHGVPCQYKKSRESVVWPYRSGCTTPADSHPATLPIRRINKSRLGTTPFPPCVLLQAKALNARNINMCRAVGANFAPFYVDRCILILRICNIQPKSALISFS